MQHGKITRAQWLVLAAAFLGWLFDGFEMGLFPVVARPALSNLLAGSVEGSLDSVVGQWIGYINAAFLLGAAAGGLIFGWLGDRIGRVKAMSLSIAVYSVFTAFGYFAQSPFQLGGLRFIAALGMGGEWSLGVALVMECWPERWRPLLAGCIGAAANCGFLLVGWVARLYPVTPDSWRWMFVVGAAPAVLVLLIRLFVPESERWQAAKVENASPLAEVFRAPLLRHTLLGITFASVALIGTWGSVQNIPSWVDQLTEGKIPGAKASAQMCSAWGAIVGSLAGPLIGGRWGRRPAYFGLCLASLAVTQILFRTFDSYSTSLLAIIFLTGLCTAAFYGWFPLYFPELFPTRARATGQGVSYNTGRVFAAAGAILGGQLVASFDGSFARAAAVITLVYIIGLAVIWIAPETRGKGLPA